MASENTQLNIEELAIKLLIRFCNDTKLIDNYLHEEKVPNAKIWHVSAELCNLVSKISTFTEEEGDEEEEEGDEEEEEEEEVEEGWVWMCHRKNRNMDECCDICDRWYCNCQIEDEEPIHSGLVTKCWACGMCKPGQ